MKIQRTILSLLCVAAMAFALGCGQKEQKAKPTPEGVPVKAEAAQAAKAEPATPPQAPAEDTEAVPTEVDFEEQAANEITAENLEDSVDKLEGELLEE